MFDLDKIENDWKNNSFRLSEDEIQQIYCSEGVTLNNNYEMRAAHRRHLLWMIRTDKRWQDIRFNNPTAFKYEIENHEYIKLKEKYPFPPKKHLSKEKQKVVVEGTMYIVFDSTRKWYQVFSEKIPMETIYYICLESLINGIHDLLHDELPLFQTRIKGKIEKNIIKYIAKCERIPYKQTTEMVANLKSSTKHHDFNSDVSKRSLDLSFHYEPNDEVEKPSKIYERVNNIDFDVDYIKNVSSEQFMCDYYKALDHLDETARLVMQLSFDRSGNVGLAAEEIGDYLGIEQQKVLRIRKEAIETLRSDIKLNAYTSH